MHNNKQSPFHRGEQEIQSRLGVREKMERFGRQVIRGYLPEQHQSFYKQLPYILVGHADKQGWAWASVIFGPPGFMRSPDPKRLEISAQPLFGDPLGDSFSEGTSLGLLGIELETRRRNRLTARIIEVKEEGGAMLGIDQSFGNCPQYIQPRKLNTTEVISTQPPTREAISQFDNQALNLIANSDTFFVASYTANDEGLPNEGADISHRGGDPGFVRIDDMKTLTIPDYSGNLHFNTLGNFLENSKAGLLFIDFKNGHLLTLTGSAEILWDSEETTLFKSAERLWKFKIDHGYWLKNVLPLRWGPHVKSVVTTISGNRNQSQSKKKETKGLGLSTADEAIVTFSESNIEQAWTNGDGSLLEFSENHGLTPPFSCRSGMCGACKVQLLSGRVAYEKEITAALKDGEILLCCAVPAKDESSQVTCLEIKL